MRLYFAILSASLLLFSYEIAEAVVEGRPIKFTEVIDSQVKATDTMQVLTFLVKTTGQGKNVDLTEIKSIASKGRIQDKRYNPDLKVIDELIAQGPNCIPFLISKLGDETRLSKPAIEFWSKTTVGDLALAILNDFFTDEDWKTMTIPGISWNEIVENRDQNLSAEEALRRFISRRGRVALKSKWTKIWGKYKNEIYWDQEARCFKRK
jgi:hypothetical protein